MVSDADDEDYRSDLSSAITERMARVGLEGQSSAEAAKADGAKDKRSGGGGPTLRSIGCVFRRTQRYNPDEGGPPERAPRPPKVEVEQKEGLKEAPVPGKKQVERVSVPFFGVQLMGGGNMTAMEITKTIGRHATGTAAPRPASEAPPATPGGARPAWDSSLGAERVRAATGFMGDVAAVRVCGMGGGMPAFSPPGCAPVGAGDTGSDTGGVGGCGGRLRDIMATAAPMRRRGEMEELGREGGSRVEGEGRGALRSLLERMSSPAKARDQGARGCLVSRLEPSGGRLFVTDRARAAAQIWLEQNDVLSGRAVRCIRQQTAVGEYPAMRHAWYEVDDVLNEPILGYHTPEEGCLLEVAGFRRMQIKQILSYIHEGISRGEAVLVHCRQGANRSATVAAAYLMIYHRFTCEDSLRLIEMRGPTPRVVRQPGFTRQLLLLESELASARASRDVRRWEDMPNNWDEVLHAFDEAPSLAAPSDFIVKKLSAQLAKGTVEAGGATPLASPREGRQEEAEQHPMVAPLEMPAGGLGMSCMGEVLEGRIWQKKLLSLEFEGGGDEGMRSVLCVAPPPLSNSDSTVMDQVIRLKGSLFTPGGEREASVRCPGRSLLRLMMVSPEERDEFVRVGRDMSTWGGEEEADAGGVGSESGGFARKAQLVVNMEDEEEEVWM